MRSDLPSQLVARQLARLIREGYELNSDGLQETTSILEAVGSGRLVDRETIDRTALKTTFWEQLPDQWPDELIGFDRALDLALDAAIGGSDEK